MTLTLTAESGEKTLAGLIGIFERSDDTLRSLGDATLHHAAWELFTRKPEAALVALLRVGQGTPLFLYSVGDYWYDVTGARVLVRPFAGPTSTTRAEAPTLHDTKQAPTDAESESSS